MVSGRKLVIKTAREWITSRDQRRDGREVRVACEETAESHGDVVKDDSDGARTCEDESKIWSTAIRW